MMELLGSSSALLRKFDFKLEAGFDPKKWESRILS
jgi:hypothetical protein